MRQLLACPQTARYLTVSWQDVDVEALRDTQASRVILPTAVAGHDPVSRLEGNRSIVVVLLLISGAEGEGPWEEDQGREGTGRSCSWKASCRMSQR